VYEVASRFADFMNNGPGLIWTVVLSALLAPPITLFHELGHALAARWRLPGSVLVNVGHGKTRWEFAVGGVDFRVGPVMPFEVPAGFCQYDAIGIGARDEAAIALAGPAATLAGLAVTVALLGHVGGTLHTIMWVAAMTQAFALAICLAPIALTDRHGRPWQTDGRLALEALRHLTPSPVRIQLSSAAETTPLAFSAVASPLCASCSHGRDEHIDLATGRSGACLGQDDDFQTLSATRCACAEYVSTY
jgi:hypothetical protein